MYTYCRPYALTTRDVCHDKAFWPVLEPAETENKQTTAAWRTVGDGTRGGERGSGVVM